MIALRRLTQPYTVCLHTSPLFMLILKLIPLFPARQQPAEPQRKGRLPGRFPHMYKYLPRHTIVKIVLPRTCLACHFPYRGARKQKIVGLASLPFLVNHAFLSALGPGSSLRPTAHVSGIQTARSCSITYHISSVFLVADYNTCSNTHSTVSRWAPV